MRNKNTYIVRAGAAYQTLKNDFIDLLPDNTIHVSNVINRNLRLITTQTLEDLFNQINPKQMLQISILEPKPTDTRYGKTSHLVPHINISEIGINEIPLRPSGTVRNIIDNAPELQTSFTYSH